MADARRQLLADLEAMASTGLNPSTGGRIGAALARRLPELIAAARELLDAVLRAGRRAHG